MITPQKREMINSSINDTLYERNLSHKEANTLLTLHSNNWHIWSIFYILILLILSIVGFFFNLFIISVVLLNRKLRSKVVYVFCCHLGIVGIVWSTVVLPYSIVTELLQTWSKPFHWCNFIGVLRNILIQMSVWTIGLLSWDKYKAIVLPLHHSTSAKPLKTIAIFSSFWITSIFINILPIIFSHGYYYDSKTSYCRVTSNIHDKENRFQIIYSTFWQIVSFYIPAFLLFFCYVRIFIVARRQNKRIVVMAAMGRVIALSVGIPLAKEQAKQHVTSRNARASHTICKFLGAFLMSYLPYAIVQLVYRHVDNKNEMASFFLKTTSILLAASPTINAFIYGVRNSVLRESFSNYLKRRFSSRKDIYKDEKNSKSQNGLLNQKADKT